MVGFQPTNLYKIGWLNQHAAATNIRLTAFGVFAETASWPEGAAPAAPLKFLPIVAGGMSGRGYTEITGAGSLLQGGPMTGSGSITLTPGAPILSLTVSFSGTGAITMTGAGALKLTIGLTGNGTWTLTGSGSLAMIVPFSGAGSFGMTGAATLKGNLSMVGSWTPFSTLSPENLAAAVWEALATDYNAAGTMGGKLNAAGSGGVDLAALAAAVLAAAQATPIHADIRKVRGQDIDGTGSEADPWGPA